jgi:hypothetical protein
LIIRDGNLRCELAITIKYIYNIYIVINNAITCTGGDMACEPEFTKTNLGNNDLLIEGECCGKCKKNEDEECLARLYFSQDGKINKNAEVSGSGYGGSKAWMRITADGDVDDGVVVLKCSCGKKITEKEHHFTIKYRLTIEDVLKEIGTLGIHALVKIIMKAAGA